MASDKSLAAEIEAVLRDQIVLRWMGPDSFVEGYEEAAQKIAARIAALQSRAFEDGARDAELRELARQIGEAADDEFADWQIDKVVPVLRAALAPNTTEGRTDRA